MHETATWSAALLALVGFGLSLGLNPALYGATVDMLAREANPWPRLSWMTAGLFAGATVLYALLQTFNPTSLVSALRGRVDEAVFNRTVDLVAGVAFLLLGAALAAWAMRARGARRLSAQPSTPPPPTPPAPSKRQTRLSGYFLIGLSSSIIGFTTLPIMYLTGRVVTGLSPELLPRALAYSVFLLALAAPFFAIAGIWRGLPRLSARISDLYSRARHWDHRWTGAALCALSGLLCLALVVFAPR